MKRRCCWSLLKCHTDTGGGITSGERLQRIQAFKWKGTEGFIGFSISISICKGGFSTFPTTYLGKTPNWAKYQDKFYDFNTSHWWNRLIGMFTKPIDHNLYIKDKNWVLLKHILLFFLSLFKNVPFLEKRLALHSLKRLSSQCFLIPKLPPPAISYRSWVKWEETQAT